MILEQEQPDALKNNKPVGITFNSLQARIDNLDLNRDLFPTDIYESDYYNLTNSDANWNKQEDRIANYIGTKNAGKDNNLIPMLNSILVQEQSSEYVPKLKETATNNGCKKILEQFLSIETKSRHCKTVKDRDILRLLGECCALVNVLKTKSNIGADINLYPKKGSAVGEENKNIGQVNQVKQPGSTDTQSASIVTNSYMPEFSPEQLINEIYNYLQIKI